MGGGGRGKILEKITDLTFLSLLQYTQGDVDLRDIMGLVLDHGNKAVSQKKKKKKAPRECFAFP